jgi:O-antigen/teichoic acid export membrane protein
VTGLVGPILTVVDRLVIGSVLGARAVTRYTVPFTLVLRTQILSSSLARTLFPRFSMLERRDAAAVGRQSLTALAAIMTPVTVVGAVVLDPFLRAWVGSDLAAHAAPVGEILLLGMWVNSLAVVPFAYLQAQGRPDLPAKFHVVEVAPYVGGLLLSLHLAGIEGAAWAWTGRAAVDALLLFWAARRISPTEPADWSELAMPAALVVASCIGSLTVFSDTVIRVSVGSLLIAIAFASGFRIARPTLRVLIANRAAQRT